MDIRVSTRDVQQFDGDALVVGVFSDKPLDGAAAAIDKALAGVIAELKENGEVRGATDEVTLLHTLGKIEPSRVAIVGLGAAKDLCGHRIRRASAIACRTLRKAGARHVGLALASAEHGLNLAQAGRAAVEGAILGLYQFRLYKGASGQHRQPAREIESITIIGRGREVALRAAVDRGRILAESQNFARDLGNEPPNVLTPTEMANRAEAMADEVGLECEIYGPEWIHQQGMGALLGVAQGSAQEPRFIVLRYKGGASRKPTLGLVGKGITFDTGGISIKPAADMDSMKMDMCGGAAVIGAMRALALLKPRLNVTGIVPATENMPGGTAYRPGDILRAKNGKTIEIVNTDAEGRLILADALCYAVEHKLSPIIDAATLTGAMVVALGHVRAGFFSNDDALIEDVRTAADAAGERLWAMPFDSEYGDLVHSEIADVKQTGGRAGGAVAAAKVLGSFVAETPWAHLDIAGTAYRDHREVDGEKGANGFAVRTFVELATLLAERSGESRGHGKAAPAI
ncbi:MAG TPA: leucyl aminopeptidase [Ktedonobacterales bacterium]